MLERIIISPPFGTWFKSIPHTSRVEGSWTIQRRRGRYIRALKTIRPLYGKASWINKIGLRTPGIDKLKAARKETDILSIAAIASKDWEAFAEAFSEHKNYGYKSVELNVGCPNTETAFLQYKDVPLFLSSFDKVIVKLPPSKKSLMDIERFYDEGIRYFHTFNTYPSSKGGVSGAFLRKVNVHLLRQLHRNNVRVKLIAGGGIYHLDDVKRYEDVGAHFFSLATVFYNPIRAHSLIRKIHTYLSGSRKEICSIR